MKIRSFTLVLVILLLAVPSVALAANAHFVSATGAVNTSGALVVNFKEAGLGGGQTIHYTLDASATAVWGCINKGGNHPQASNKETVAGPVLGTGSFTAAKNGNIAASITAGPLPMPPGFSCSGKMVIALVSVSYSNIVLTDTITPVSVSIPSVSRVFYQ